VIAQYPLETILPGQEYEIVYRIFTKIPVQGAAFEFAYNPTVAELLGVSKCGFFGDEGDSLSEVILSDTSEGKVIGGISYLSNGRIGKTGEGVFLKVRFRAETSHQARSNLIPEITFIAPNGHDYFVVEINKPKEGPEKLPTEFSLSQNYPNPFNSSTIIRFGIKETCPVELTLYNLLGQRVVTLLDQIKQPGFYAVRWDGRNARGVPVGSGIYFCKLQAGSFKSIKKLALLK